VRGRATRRMPPGPPAKVAKHSGSRARGKRPHARNGDCLAQSKRRAGESGVTATAHTWRGSCRRNPLWRHWLQEISRTRRQDPFPQGRPCRATLLSHGETAVVSLAHTPMRQDGDGVALGRHALTRRTRGGSTALTSPPGPGARGRWRGRSSRSTWLWRTRRAGRSPGESRRRASPARLCARRRAC